MPPSTNPSEPQGVTESLVLAACPSAARCAKWLVRVELGRWGLAHLAAVVESLTNDLVDLIVQIIGPIEPPAAWEDDKDVPMIRCELWSDQGMVGVRVWDPTAAPIPVTRSSSLYPSVQWGQSATEPLGKWSWFQLPATLAIPDPDAPLTIPIPRITQDMIAPGTGGIPKLRINRGENTGPIDRFFDIELPPTGT